MTKAISSLNVTRIEEQQAEVDRLTKELTTWRQKYRREIRKENPSETQLEYIIRKGSEVSNSLQALPQLPPLRAMANENELEVIEEIQLLLIWLVENLNISNTLTAEQLENIASLILHEYGAMRLEDVAMVMRGAIKGSYGVIYNRLDAAIILDWFRQHAELLQDIRHRRQMDIYMSTKERNNEPIEIQQSAEMSAALIFLHNANKVSDGTES